VVGGVADPLGSGLVASLAHPGGNVTGAMVSTLQDPKGVDLLKDSVPGLAHLAILFNPAAGAAPLNVPLVEQSAAAVGIQALRAEARSADDFESAFAQARAWSVQVLFVLSESSLIQPNYGLIADVALRSLLPSMSVNRGYAEAGGLTTYGPNMSAI